MCETIIVASVVLPSCLLEHSLTIHIRLLFFFFSLSPSIRFQSHLISKACTPRPAATALGVGVGVGVGVGDGDDWSSMMTLVAVAVLLVMVV
jgi:hypothetical protein